MKAIKIRNLLRRSYFYFTIVILTAAVFVACIKKADEVTQPIPPTDTIPSIPPGTTPPNNPPLRCAYSPDYGDSLLCGDVSVKQGGSSDYIVSPRNFPGQNVGKYVSYPIGLKIDENTGAIDVTQSESGMIYHVGYVRKGTTDTCFTKVIIAGITYIDGVHILSDNDTLAVPVYNGDPAGKPVCGTGGDFSQCTFDDPADAGGVNYTCNAKNIKLDTKTGVISLDRSLLAGLFGLLPKNGDNKQATVYYRLADCSGMALRSIDIDITYYYRLSDVPASLINTINTAQKDLLKALFGREASGASTNPRPPHIVIVASH